MPRNKLPVSDDLYVIHSAEVSDTNGEPMYWSNEDGWVTLPSATVFPGQTRQYVHLPLSGETSDAEWIKLPYKAPFQEIERLRAVLRLIAAPQRRDGTWNRDREACRRLAREELGEDS